MKIINLIENTPGAPGCLYEHGLSFYIETKDHKLLVDTGASDKFIKNAETLGVNLKAVDTVILSHGHYDHSGGILAFAEQNGTAKIYLQKTAGEAYYHADPQEVRYIGIDPEIQSLPQLEWVPGDKKLDEELELFSGVTGRKLWPKGNLILKKKVGETFVQDEFDHEQYLVISCDNKKILISGCAHNGILNILEGYRQRYQNDPDAVISGFHMMKKAGYTESDIAMIKETAEILKQTDIQFFTGHCTGEVPYAIMKEILGDQLEWVHSGKYLYF